MNKTLITLAVAGILTGTAATATQAAEAFSFSLGDLLQISVVNAGPRDHEDRGPAWYNPPPPPPEHRREAVQPPPPKHRHKTSRHQTARNGRHAAPAGHGDKGVRPAKPQAPAKPQPAAKPQAPAKPQPPAQPRH